MSAVASQLRSRVSVQALIGRVRDDSLLRNSLLIMSTTVVNSAFGFVFWLLAARLFSTQVVGLTAALIATATIVVLLASLGVGGMLIQSLPEQRERAGWSQTLWAGMVTATSTSVAIAAAALLLLPALSHEVAALGRADYAVLFVVGTVTMTAGGVLDYVFIAQRAAGNMLGRNAAVAAAKLGAIVLLSATFASSGVGLLAAWAIACVLGLALGLLLLVRQTSLAAPVRPTELIRIARRHRARLAGHQLIGMGGAMLPYLLPLVVTTRLSSSDNAYFYTTWMMAGIFLIIAPAVSQSLFAEGVHNPHELMVKARSALALIGAILVPGIVAIFVLGGPLLSAFGPAYEQHAEGLLRLVLVASIADAITQLYVAVLRVEQRLRTAAALNLGMGAGTVLLSWAFLPRLGINAVGWSFLAMQLCGCVFVAFDVRRPRPVPAGPMVAPEVPAMEPV